MRPPACVDCKHHKVNKATRLCIRGKRWNFVLGIEVTTPIDCYEERKDKIQLNADMVLAVDSCGEQGKYFEKA